MSEAVSPLIFTGICLAAFGLNVSAAKPIWAVVFLLLTLISAGEAALFLAGA